MERGRGRVKGNPRGTLSWYLYVCMYVYIYIRGRNVGIAACRIVNTHDHNLLYKTETAGGVVKERNTTYDIGLPAYERNVRIFVERLGTILTEVLGCFNIYLIS